MSLLPTNYFKVLQYAAGLQLFVAAAQAATFSDANWVSLGGLPGTDGGVTAAVTDASGNLYIGGGFTAAGNVVANNVAKWNGSGWSALGSGVNGRVYALAVSGGTLYASYLLPGAAGP